MNRRKKIYTTLVCVGTLLLGSLLGYAFANARYTSRLETQISLLRPANSNYQFINPLVGVDLTPQQSFPEMDRIKEQVGTYIKSEVAAGRAARASVYFRNVFNAHWMALNENETFDPGSLLKVPIMIAYFKEAETDPSVLDRKIFYAPSATERRLPNELVSTLVPNREYAAQDLIKAMIIESDNAAKDLLLDNLDSKYITEVYGDLGIPLVGPTSDRISAKIYASFFRRLYNATFLNREYSEKALKLLGESTFTNGIIKGLKTKIQVAHKYGERGVYDKNGALIGAELHDCGILYFPEKPELLCIMTEGKNLSHLETIIQTITKTVSAHPQ